MTRTHLEWFGAGCLMALAVCIAGCSHGWGDSWKPSHWRSRAIPNTYPLGSTVRAHSHTMETNAEAADFILYRMDFAGETAQLVPAARDRLPEIAARMRSTPFPVLVERSENNCNPELDAQRRQLVAQILYDFGVPEADQRTIVSPSYSRGFNSIEAEFDYYRFLYSRGGGNFGGMGGGGFGNGGAAGGGFGFSH